MCVVERWGQLWTGGGKIFPHTNTFVGHAGLENEIIKESSKKKEIIEIKYQEII